MRTKKNGGEEIRKHLEKDGGIKKVKKLKYGRTEGKEGRMM